MVFVLAGFMILLWVCSMIPTATAQSRSRVAQHERHLLAVVAAAGFTSIVVACVVLMIIRWWLWKRLKNEEEAGEDLCKLTAEAGVLRKFSFQELRDATSNFSRRIRRGGFGSYFEGVLSSGARVAVKRLGKQGGQKKQFMAEVMEIGSIQHANLVKLRGSCTHKSGFLLVYDYMPNGSLEKWLFTSKAGEFLPWNARFQIVLDVARGLAHLHEGCREQVLHLDLKPENILLDDGFRAKIADFGFSKLGTEKDKSVRGTPGYMAPEWLQMRVSEKTDVYSLGIVILEIVSGLRTIHAMQTEQARYLVTWAFQVAHKGDLLEMVDERILQEVASKCRQVENMIKTGLWCIQSDPRLRPSIASIVKMLEEGLDVIDPPLPPPPPEGEAIDMDFSLSVVMEMMHHRLEGTARKQGFLRPYMCFTRV